MKDLVIIGAGPAGLSAAIYAARYKLNFALIGKSFGGAINKAPLIENYLGIKSAKGKDLIKIFREQIDQFNIEYIEENVTKIEKGFKVHTENKVIECKSIILALGLNRNLKITNEDKFVGKGVSYCISCDAPLYKDLTVAFIGEKNSLIEKYAKQVIYLKENEIKELNGEKFLESITLKDKTINVDGLFIEREGIYNNELINSLGLHLDKDNFVIVNDEFETNIKGVYCVGDICNKTKLKQFSVAVAQGAIAAYSIYKK